MYEHRTLTLLFVDLPVMRLCCALHKLCAVCIYLAIKPVVVHMPNVTMILFKHFFKLCEIGECTCNCNLVNFCTNYNYTRTKNLNYNYNYVKICD